MTDPAEGTSREEHQLDGPAHLRAEEPGRRERKNERKNGGEGERIHENR